MPETAGPSNPAKRSARGQAQQPTIKGCSCKRSQCIKNYCDCYQSMAVCTKYCRCIGCRNDQERKNVPPAPKSSTAKRDRAAAMSAKVAAAAAAKVAKASVQVKGGGKSAPLKPPPPITPTAVPKAGNGEKTSMTTEQQSNGVVGDKSSTNASVKPTPSPAAAKANKDDPVTSQEENTESQPKKKEQCETIIFSRAVNAALLECALVQATEAEQLGLNEVQIGHLVLHELLRAMNILSENNGLDSNWT